MATSTAIEPYGGGHQTLKSKNALAKDQDEADRNPETQLINRTVSRSDLLGRFTTFCLVINRTIASGIFTQPYNVMIGVGNPGAALLTWIIAGILALCITACWTELGLSIPRHLVNGQWVSTPKSGGDKNYLEYIFKSPDLLMTCVFGIEFLVFGNLAGNAIQFGIYMQSVINPSCQDQCVQNGPVVGWAIFVLTLCALLNITTRKFSIRLNNLFAVAKILVVFLMIWIGIGYGTKNGDGCKKIVWQSQGEGGKVGDIILSLFYATYPYTGYEQPFYVLAEVRQPKRLFAKSVMWTMASLIVVYTLINTSYLCMNPYEGSLEDNKDYSTNAAINFFYKLSKDRSDAHRERVVQGISAMLAVFIFGNLLAQTYTASRVKQEIAKEGILPKSLWFAASKNTLVARWFQSINPEQAPFAATALHWGVEVVLVLSVGLSLSPNKAYNFLTYIYTFVIVGLLGFLTVCGLLYLKIDAWWRSEPRRVDAEMGPNQGKHIGRGWSVKREWKPWLDPLPCIFAVAVLGFLLFGAFTKPSGMKSDDLEWWVMPLVGWLSLLVGVVWWLGLEVQQWRGGYRIKRKRVTYVEQLEEEDPVQTAELVIVDKIYETEDAPIDEGMLEAW
ncbi:hypothetical protein OQA88_10465 [Cercophora sp. LCS_1]